GIEHRQVEQPRRARRRRRPTPALPDVEADVVVIAAGREERCRPAVVLLHLEAEHVAVEGLRAVEVGNLEMDVADRGAGRDRVVAHRRKVSQKYGCWLITTSRPNSTSPHDTAAAIRSPGRAVRSRSTIAP